MCRLQQVALQYNVAKPAAPGMMLLPRDARKERLVRVDTKESSIVLFSSSPESLASHM
jgi:hypothetical protein